MHPHQPPGGRGGTAGAHAARGRRQAHPRSFCYHDHLRRLRAQPCRTPVGRCGCARGHPPPATPHPPCLPLRRLDLLSSSQAAQGPPHPVCAGMHGLLRRGCARAPTAGSQASYGRIPPVVPPALQHAPGRAQEAARPSDTTIETLECEHAEVVDPPAAIRPDPRAGAAVQRRLWRSLQCAACHPNGPCGHTYAGPVSHGGGGNPPHAQPHSAGGRDRSGVASARHAPAHGGTPHNPPDRHSRRINRGAAAHRATHQPAGGANPGCPAALRPGAGRRAPTYPRCNRRRRLHPRRSACGADPGLRTLERRKRHRRPATAPADGAQHTGSDREHQQDLHRCGRVATG